jgi:hypothetical protein
MFNQGLVSVVLGAFMFAADKVVRAVVDLGWVPWLAGIVAMFWIARRIEDA